MMDLDRPVLSRPMTTPAPAEGLSSLAAELADIRRGYEARCPGGPRRVRAAGPG